MTRVTTVRKQGDRKLMKELWDEMSTAPAGSVSQAVLADAYDRFVNHMVATYGGARGDLVFNPTDEQAHLLTVLARS